MSSLSLPTPEQLQPFHSHPLPLYLRGEHINALAYHLVYTEFYSK